MRQRIVVLLISLAIDGSARADVVYSTLGSVTPGHSTTDGATVAGPSSLEPLALAEQFVPSIDSFVDSVDLALLFPSVLSAGASVTVSVLPNIETTDLPDTATANLLASVTVPLPLNVGSALVTADFNSETATIGVNDGRVDPANAYWVVVTTNSDNEFIWSDTNDGSLESFQGVSTDNGLSWSSIFRTAAPEDGFPPLAAFSVHATPAMLLGDTDQDFDIDANDIDFLFANFGPSAPVNLDLDLDGDADQADVDTLVRGILLTEYGDANLSGSVNSSDAAILGGNFGTLVNGTWSMGDFNGDKAINSSDAAIMGGNFGFMNPLGGTASESLAGSINSYVPEPTTHAMFCVGLLVFSCLSRSGHKPSPNASPSAVM